MSILDTIRKPTTGGGDARSFALTVIKKNLADNPPNFDVRDDEGNDYKLVTRAGNTPLAEVKVKVGGVVIAEGAYQEKDAATPTLSSRYVTAGFPDKNAGQVIKAVARPMLVGGKDSEKSVRIELVDPPIKVSSMDEARAAFVDAIEKNRSAPGWPGAVVNVQEVDANGNVGGESFRISAGTQGEAGKKTIAPAEAQAKHFDLKAGERMNALFQAIEQSGLPDGSVTISVLPCQVLGLGKDTNKLAKTHPAFAGMTKGDDGFEAKGMFGRFLPTETITSQGGKSYEAFTYTPVLISAFYVTDSATGERTNRLAVSKVTPVISGDDKPSVSARSLIGIEKAFAAMSTRPQISSAPEIEASESAATSDPSTDDFDIDAIEASLLEGDDSPSM